ncbi:T9SS C-terminal target domain-containing protein [Flavobacterium arcticum]|uniref:T9SS C-terminal target domain-containing protein n=1 Tax=Flavobacterium arcticum TaxID=1784713 RepID=A0A345HEW4_9FLAO|nr:FG-GAP-like repeat-containing protein [Flavobacterium arcticum]AXG75124.1 T9SS C-terminal target domain-containing protein [Flavobacterium arcticum]KAF2511096.1 T9SS type A sorting domain-containing protein [Flavobacterium arcticum]
MKKIFTLLITGLGIVNLTAQNTCATAQPATIGINNVSYADGSEVPLPICIGGTNNEVTKGAWYTYSSTEILNITISTDPEGFPILDTRVHIYTGDCDNLICEAGDDDSGEGYSSVVEFTAQPDVLYYISFDNYWDSNDFVFEVEESEYIAPMFEAVSLEGITGQYIMCVADMNGDYLDDIAVPGSGSITMLYQNTDGTFNGNLVGADNTPYMPGWSLAAGDYDGNGYNDLLYGSGSGATIMLANEDGSAYTAMISPQSIFSQRTNFVDLNNDGNLDAFVCHDVEPNVYFLNDGDSSFEFIQGGIGDYITGGNYGSIWVDYDNDGDPDLFIAKCRGGGDDAGINELHRNDGDGVFTNVSIEAGMADIVQTWSTAFGDFDNDGDMDAMVGANSTSHGTHKLMINNNDGTFSDSTEGSGFDTFNQYGREHITHDFNNDGFLDVMGGGTFIMFNNGDMTFTPVNTGSAVVGAIGDLNDDGFLDILNGNKIMMNGGNDNNWLKIHLEGTDSNKNGIGARVEIYGSGDVWQKQIRDVRSGDGFRYMSSLNTHFGLGQTDEIDQVVIKWPSGIIDIIENPTINESLMVVEGSTLGINNVSSTIFNIYPNPVKDVIQFSTNENISITNAYVYDISGRLITTQAVSTTSIPVQHLSAGTYILILKDASGKHYSSKIVKE